MICPWYFLSLHLTFNFWKTRLVFLSPVITGVWGVSRKDFFLKKKKVPFSLLEEDCSQSSISQLAWSFVADLTCSCKAFFLDHIVIQTWKASWYFTKLLQEKLFRIPENQKTSMYGARMPKLLKKHLLNTLFLLFFFVRG